MNWVADENIDQPIVERLRSLGERVWYAAEMAPSESDAEVLAVANREAAVVLTADKDFGALVFHQRLATQGVVLLRLAGMGPQAKADRVADFVAAHAHETRGAFTVVTPTRLRFRLAP